MSSKNQITLNKMNLSLQKSLSEKESSLNKKINNFALRKQFCRIIPNCYMSLQKSKSICSPKSKSKKNYNLYLTLKNEITSMKSSILYLENERNEKLEKIEKLRIQMRSENLKKNLIIKERNNSINKNYREKNNEGNIGCFKSVENECSIGSTDEGFPCGDGSRRSGDGEKSDGGFLEENNENDDPDLFLRFDEKDSCVINEIRKPNIINSNN